MPACETDNDWLATIRAGYAADRILFYGTAGGAFGDIRANVDPTWTHQNKAGWSAGAGIEAAFADNWTARLEYLFIDPQNATFRLFRHSGDGQIRRQYRPRRHA